MKILKWLVYISLTWHVIPIYAAIAISAGGGHTCALTNDSQVVCWGYNTYGQTTPPTGLNNVKAISAGGYHTCALTNDSQVVCWGYNFYDQITPPTELSNVKAISAGEFHTCALTNDGQVVCWGENNETPPTGLNNFKAISAGYAYTCALTNDGQVVCWGNSFYDQITPPTGLSNVQAISLGSFHACALTNDDQVVCWGYNSDGQATPPTGLSHVQAISARGFHTCALTNDSQIVCWGDNYETPPTGLNNVKAISAGDAHNCALTNDGQVVCWGNNSGGQISLSFPIELSNITVSNFENNVLIQWETSVELKSAGFRLRRATMDPTNGGYSFVVLGESNSRQIPDPNGNCSNEIQGQLKIVKPDQNNGIISAVGNSRESTCYSFIDTNLSNGTYYYLLENVNDNGKITSYCDQINAITIGQGPVINLGTAIYILCEIN